MLLPNQPRSARCLAKLTACLACWLVGGANLQAAPASDELQFAQAVLLFEQGDYQQAQALFQAVSEAMPAAGAYVELCQADIRPAAQPAGYEYENEQTLGPVDGDWIGETTWDEGAMPGCGECVGCGDSGNAGGAAQSPCHVTLLTGYQYDSNVTLQPEFIGLGSGRDISDSSWLVAAFGDYQLVTRPEFNLGLIGSAFSNHYFSANEFDAQDFMAGFYANKLLSPSSLLGVRYEFHESLLDYSSFADQHRLVPNLTLLQGDYGHVTFYYELEHQEFSDSPLIPAMERSGDTHSVGVTQAIYTWGGDGRLYAGYRFDRSLTDGDDFDRRTHMATARLEIPFSRTSIFDAEVRQFWDDYDNANSLDFDGRRREDRRTEVRTGLQFICNRHTSLRFDYTYINSDSNTANLFGVRFFDYDRHLFSTQLIYDF